MTLYPRGDAQHTETLLDNRTQRARRADSSRRSLSMVGILRSPIIASVTMAMNCASVVTKALRFWPAKI